MDARVEYADDPDREPGREVIPAPPPGSMRLRNGRHELFAYRIAAHVPKVVAYCEAYGITDPNADEYHAARGNAARLERRKDVQARIAWHARQSDDMLQAKRERLERWLWAVMEHNPAELWEVAERPLLDADGEPVIKDDKFVMVKYQRAKFLADLPPDALAAIEGLQITESGKVVTKTYSKMQANQELRKLLGIGNTNGTVVGDVADMSTAEIVAELQTLGVDVRLSVSVTR